MKRIIEYIPLVSACFLFFGFIDLYTYYNEFNIDIYMFISSGDLILFLFPKIIVVAISFFLFYTMFTMMDKSYRDDSVLVDKESLWKLYKKRRLVIGLLFLFILLAIFLTFEKRSSEFFIKLAFCGLFFWVLLYVVRFVTLFRVLNTREMTFRGVSILAFVLFLLRYNNIDKASNIKHGVSDHKTNYISFIYRDSIQYTNDSLLYIGSTSQYLFLYNLKDSSSTIYPYSDISYIKIKSSYFP